MPNSKFLQIRQPPSRLTALCVAVTLIVLSLLVISLQRDIIKEEIGDFLKKSLLFSFSFIGQIGFSTALPLVIFGVAGRYLDKKLGTSPYLLLLGLLLATILIFFIVRNIVKKAIGEIHKLND